MATYTISHAEQVRNMTPEQRAEYAATLRQPKAPKVLEKSTTSGVKLTKLENGVRITMDVTDDMLVNHGVSGSGNPTCGTGSGRLRLEDYFSEEVRDLLNSLYPDLKGYMTFTMTPTLPRK